MPDYTLFNLKVSVLTPVHIGNGVELLYQYDYAIHGGQTWRINDAALLDAQNVEDPKMADILSRTPPVELLKPNDFQPQSPFFRYVIKGVPRSQAEGAQLREQIKNPFDQVYLPGSSLKGAFRTALGWYIWQQSGIKLKSTQLNPKREWAAQRYEQQIFGPNPNKDLLRALHVSDSAPLSADCLMVLNVRVVNRGGNLAAPIEVEAIRRNTIFEQTIKIDNALFSNWAKKHNLHLKGAELLQHLAEVVNHHTKEHIRQEIAWFSEVARAQNVLNYYRQLEQKEPGKGQMLLRLGWGTGWNDKTFGTVLQKDPQTMEHLIQKYRLARGKRKPGDPFPKSRRVAMAVVRNQQGQVVEVPAYPLGWVLVEVMQA
jgi:CRISPR-associated protein Csm5